MRKTLILDSALSILLLVTCLALLQPHVEAQSFPDVKQLTSNTVDDHYGSGLYCNDHILSWNGSKLVFWREHSSTEYKVYVMNTSDAPGQEKLMTTAPGRNNFGSISSDGSKIAFGSNRKNPSDPWFAYEIFVMNSTDLPGDEVQLTNDALLDHSPDISGNGEFVAWHSAPTSYQGFDIRVANISDMTSVTVATLPTGPENDEFASASMTADGASLSFWKDTGGYDNYGDIATIRTDGSGLNILTTTGDFYVTQAMSRGGRYVACQRRVGTDLEIFVYDLQTASLTQLTDNEADDFLGGISDDGSIVTYSRNGHIFVHDMASEVQVTDGFADEYPRISGDGKVIVFSSTNRDGPDYDIFMVTLSAHLEAAVDLHPKTLNLKSDGRWITAYIELPEGYDVADIDVSTLWLNGSVVAEASPTSVGDHDNDGVPDLMVKFSRSEVTDYIISALEAIDEPTWITLTITGSLEDDTEFEGSDTIRVICRGGGGPGKTAQLA